jgi:hypothetical protein
VNDDLTNALKIGAEWFKCKIGMSHGDSCQTVESNVGPYINQDGILNFPHSMHGSSKHNFHSRKHPLVAIALEIHWSFLIYCEYTSQNVVS